MVRYTPLLNSFNQIPSNMKTKTKKLSLNKLVIQKLTDNQLTRIVGGNGSPTLKDLDNKVG